MNLPEDYVIKMKKLLGNEFNDYIKSFNDNRHFGIRVNTLKIDKNELKRLLKFDLSPITWCKEGFYYNEDEKPSKSPYYYAGLYYIQEPSAMSTGAVIDIQPNDKVLDICAAPGGKSTQIGAKLKNTGLLVSNDISASRCKALLKNIEIFGLTNCIITNEIPEKLAEKFQGFFDKIIVDAPCSGEGMFRKDYEAVKSWEKHKTEVCSILQRNILNNAAKMLNKDGVIAYSTCTFAPEENECMIDEFLTNNKEFELISIDKSLGFSDGIPDWTASKNKEIKKCGRLWPHKVNGEGHFICLLKKRENDNNINNAIKRIRQVNKKELELFYLFMNDYMNIEIDGYFEIHGEKLFSIPYGIDLSGLRVVRSGFYIGDLKNKRFEPSQAFAMGIKKDDAKYSINFSVNDEFVLRYLKGESFKINAKEGWNLVCVDGFPLGWGKVQNGRLKNKYLPSWKMQ